MQEFWSYISAIFKPKCVTHVFTHFVQRLDMYYAASELLTIRMLTLLNYFPAFKNSKSIRWRGLKLFAIFKLKIPSKCVTHSFWFTNLSFGKLMFRNVSSFYGATKLLHTIKMLFSGLNINPFWGFIYKIILYSLFKSIFDSTEYSST